jgi:hypothetical protein
MIYWKIRKSLLFDCYLKHTMDLCYSDDEIDLSLNDLKSFFNVNDIYLTHLESIE